MTATNAYVSCSVGANIDRKTSINGSPTAQAAGFVNFGTSSYASDPFELRISTNATNSHSPPGITKYEVLRALETFKAWVLDPTYGLDAVLNSNGDTFGVP